MRGQESSEQGISKVSSFCTGASAASQVVQDGSGRMTGIRSCMCSSWYMGVEVAKVASGPCATKKQGQTSAKPSEVVRPSLLKADGFERRPREAGTDASS